MRFNYLIACMICILSGITVSLAQESGTLKGYVYDHYGPVTGATIYIEGTTSGVTSDLDGRFVLGDIPDKSTIIVSMLGYETQHLRYRGQDSLSIELTEVANRLSEAVVTALGIERDKMALSYNVQQINSEAISTIKDGNFVNSMIGKTAGIQISSGAAGQGSATRVVMRGMKSIEKSNSALYVIDGIPMYNAGSFGSSGAFGGGMGTEAAADINPDDIESISMLTGASAAALYGSAAANGVILITTKKGKEGKTSVTFNSSTMFSQINSLPELQSRYGGNTTNSWEGGTLSDSNYDPMSFFQTSFNTMNTISVSGGNSKNMVYASASSTNSSNVLPGASYNRYNFTGRSTSYLAKDKIVLDFGANYIIQNNTNMIAQGRYYNPLPSLYLFPRGEDYSQLSNFERYDDNLGYSVQYWPYGPGDHDMQNPYWVMYRR